MEVYTRGNETRETITSTGDGAAMHDRSLPQLLRDLSNDSMTLIRKEAQLFRAETEQKITTAQRQGIVLGAGGMIAYLGLLSLTAALVLALALVMPAWLAALLVGFVLIAAGVTAMVMGKNRLQSEQLAPKESIRSVKNDVRMVREAVR
ncbi:phage holin family protein [Sandaracinus amylolyticus]|uniref:Putative integral membrane protein n=1 Tax=Sandaracinus amylolyticus TaxID=927083 RepID=A0A0F6YJQ2_9BACT|nr:phage holin family protein [Sandaracinus amylolyticus]AKF06363.1 putative integral membrane protein [Sandaracinus amylolyticus]